MQIIPSKKYIVWYLPGSGGFFVSWLLQVAINPHTLPSALRHFPLILKYKHTTWKYYEYVPPDIGVLCNMLMPSDIPSDMQLIEYHVNNTLTSVFNGRVNLQILIKYYLINYVWFKTYFYEKDEYQLLHSTEYNQLAEMQYIDLLTQDITSKKIIAVTASDEFIALSSKYKNVETDIALNNQYNKNIGKHTTNIFNMRSIFNNTYLKSLERLLNKRLSNEEIEACNIFVDRYINIIPQTTLT